MSEKRSASPAKNGSKRQKITLSCNECRRRKIKCDHGKPVCENCVKRGSNDACVYARSPWIDIIAAESKVYQEIDALKRENDELMDQVASVKAELTLLYKRNHNSVASDVSGNANMTSVLDNRISTSETGSLVSYFSNSNTNNTPTTTASSTSNNENDIDAQNKKKFSKFEYHFIKDTTEIPLKSRVRQILASDMPLVELQSYHDVEYPRLVTSLRCPNDAFYKGYFLSQLISTLPKFDIIEYQLNYYFNSNYHKVLPILSPIMVLESFHKLFNKSTNKIEIDPSRELEDFVQLGIILIVLKITTLYKDNPLTDPTSALLKNAYIAVELGDIKIRASLATLQALLLITSFKYFSHRVPDLELFFATELCRDMAIALGIHKNTEIIYEHKSKEEKEVIHNIKVMLNRGY